jgi:anti-anti-sigma factor
MNDVLVVLERIIPAEDNAASRICTEFRTALLAHFMGSPAESRIFAMELVAREAVQNAVDYGCARDSTKNVKFHAELIGGILRLVVMDEGPGFDTEAVISRERGSILSTSGNGIRIIAAYADRYEYKDKGRILEVDFFLGKENVMRNLQKEANWSPKTDLIAANIQAAKEVLRSLVASSVGEFVVDLAKVAMIDSKGLGLLIATVNSLETTGRKMRVIGARTELLDLFKMMRFEHHMTIG